MRIIAAPRLGLVCSWILLGASAGLLGDTLLSVEPVLQELLVRSNADRVIWPSLLACLAVFGAIGVRQHAYSAWATQDGLRFAVGIWPFQQWYDARDVKSWSHERRRGGDLFRIRFNDGRRLSIVEFRADRTQSITEGLSRELLNDGAVNSP